MSDLAPKYMVILTLISRVAYISFIMIFAIGPIVNIYAQPLFPQWGPVGTTLGNLPNDNSQAQTEENEVTNFNNTRLLGSAEMYLVEAIKSLHSGDMIGSTRNLNLSDQQFTSVLFSISFSQEPSSEETDNQKSIALGGTYLVKSLQSQDKTNLDKNLNVSLQQFAPIVHISPWTRILQPAPTAAAGNAGATVEPVNYSDTQLLALAGIHLSHAIKALQNNNTSTLDTNLAISHQQLRQTLGD